MEQHGLIDLTKRYSDLPLKNFKKVKIKEKILYISNLISIKEFKVFLKDSDYFSRRDKRGDNWKPVNQEDQCLPVCVNWYDANAYIALLESKLGRPFRLLKINEYVNIHPGAKPVKRRDGILSFEFPDGKKADVYNKYYDEDIWQSIKMRFNKDKLSFVKNSDGLEFLISSSFGEWLFEYGGHGAAAINTNDLKSIRGLGTPVERDFFPAYSVGKYKKCKLGFRVCYLTRLSHDFKCGNFFKI